MESRVRTRLLQAAGLLILAVALLADAEPRRASLCPYRSLLDGGPQLPGFCIDFDNPRAAPMLLSGLALLAVVLGVLWWAAGKPEGWGVLLRCLLLVGLAGALLVFVAWTAGIAEISCLVQSDGGVTFCSERHAAWEAWAYAVGGALLGAATTGALGLLWLARRGRR